MQPLKLVDMKKLYISFILLSTTLLANSQGVDEAYLFAKENSFGTARAVGMGGAFGALGGDMSGVQINPAGVAVFRSPELTFTPSFQWDNTTSNYYGTQADASKFRFTINQFGYVGVDRPMREPTSGIVSINYAFNYQRVSDFNTTTQISGNNIQSSLLDQFRFEADGTPVDNLDSYRSGLAYDTYLLDLRPNLPDNSNLYYNALETINPSDNLPYRESTLGVNQWCLIEKRGRVTETGGSAGINISNKLFLGTSLNIALISYDLNTFYSEYNPSKNSSDFFNSFNYNSYIDTEGLGINFKFGAIYKPIEALRLGFAFQTPTWYAMTERYSYEMDSYLNGVDTDGNNINGAYKLVGGEFDYNYNTPLKLTGSIGLILGGKVAIDLDYKYIDYSNASYNATNYDYSSAQQMTSINNEIKAIYQATNNFNAGIEVKPIPSIALRGGFIYNQGAIKNSNSDTFTYSAGIGYRIQNYFVDVAYRLQSQEYTYYPYQLDNSLIAEGFPNQPATVKNNTSLALFTVGMKF